MKRMAILAPINYIRYMYNAIKTYTRASKPCQLTKADNQRTTVKEMDSLSETFETYVRLYGLH